MAIMQNSVVELCPAFPDKVAKFFKEIFASGTFTIPAQKPPKEEIVNIDVQIELVDVETVPVFLSGNTSTTPDGNKIFVAGNIYLGVQYSALRDDQKVHFVRFQLPFETILLSDCGELIDSADLAKGYVVHVCLEKGPLHTQIDPRTINFELLLMIWAEQI